MTCWVSTQNPRHQDVSWRPGLVSEKENVLGWGGGGQGGENNELKMASTVWGSTRCAVDIN